MKRGSFWYYTESVKKGGRITAVDGLTIPDTERAGKDAYVSVSVYAEAIQASGIKPDFSREDPWKGAESDHKTGSSGGMGGTGRPGVIWPGNSSGSDNGSGPGGSTQQGPGGTQQGPGTSDGNGTIQTGTGPGQDESQLAADPGTQGGSAGSGNGSNAGRRPPATGDDFPYVPLLALMAASAAGLLIIAKTRKDGEQE